MKGANVKTRAVAAVACTLFAFFIVGCSDKSRMRFYIGNITDNSAERKSYIEGDICKVGQEFANVTLTVEAPTQNNVGPKYGVIIKGYYLDYYYYDPADGQYKGPIGLLNFSAGSLNVRIDPGTAQVVKIPVAQYAVKAWANKVPCTGYGAYSGTGARVERMVARITFNGEDLTGKTVSAEGSVLLYLYFDSVNGCVNGSSPYDYLSTFCQ